MNIKISEGVELVIRNNKHLPIVIEDDECSSIFLSNSDAKKLVYELNQHFLRNNK